MAVSAKETSTETYTQAVKRQNTLCIDGFIREMKIEQIVPSEINDLCLNYYHISNDKFDSEFECHQLELHNMVLFLVPKLMERNKPHFCQIR